MCCTVSCACAAFCLHWIFNPEHFVMDFSRIDSAFLLKIITRDKICVSSCDSDQTAVSNGKLALTKHKVNTSGQECKQDQACHIQGGCVPFL